MKRKYLKKVELTSEKVGLNEKYNNVELAKLCIGEKNNCESNEYLILNAEQMFAFIMCWIDGELNKNGGIYSDAKWFIDGILQICKSRGIILEDVINDCENTKKDHHEKIKNKKRVERNIYYKGNINWLD